jgi:biopolymer transport protein ExbB/TolQ
MWAQVGEAITSMNIYVMLMFGLLFIGSMFIFERIILLQFIFNLDFKKFTQTLKKMILAEDYDRALNYSKNASKTSLPRICVRAIEAAEKDLSSVRGVIEEETLDFLPRIEARVQVIPVFATLVLFMGVLGTVDELWTSFESVGVLDTAQKQSAVGHGVSGSLVYTALGLVISCFFILAHQLVRGMAMRLIDRVQHGVMVISNLLVPNDGSQSLSYASAGVTAGSSEPAPVTSFSESVPEPAKEIAKATAPEEDDAGLDDIKDEEEII